MKIRAMTRKQSRMLALFLLLAVLALAVAIIALPVFLLNRHYDQAIEQQQDLLARYSRIGATAPGLAEQLEKLKARAARDFFLKSPVPALAASEVQEIVERTAEANDGKISTMRISEHKDDGKFRKVTVNIQMSAGIGAIQKIFYALETQHPYLILDNVSIRSASRPASRDLAVQDQGLLVQFDVVGHAIPGAKQ